MRLLIEFLLLAAVAGQFTRSLDWRGYAMTTAAGLAVALMFYYGSANW